MSILLEFTINADAFQLGRVLSSTSGTVLELERIVPSGSMAMPFVWATGDEYQTFEEDVRAHPTVRSLIALDRFENQGLYRVGWRDSPADLIAAIQESDAVILEARGNETWEFRLRFFDHDSLSVFHDAVREMGLAVHIERTATLEASEEQRFELTPEQREALSLAVRRGYFASPGEVQLEELADELGISRQALSKRIRRGNEKILGRVLLSPETATD